MKIEIYSPTIRRKEMDAVLTAMVEEKIGPGDRSALLVQTAKEQLKFDYALALRSPAVALHLALTALNVKKGQAVIISALSPRYYLQVLKDLHLTPLFCDTAYDFPCMNRELIENTIAKNKAVSADDGQAAPQSIPSMSQSTPPAQDLEICAIVLHHTLGYTPDAAAIAEIGIPVIEDVSQSYGSALLKEEPAAASRQTKPESVFYILGLEERDMLTSGGGAILYAMNRKEGSLLRGFSGIAGEYCLPDINAALAVVQFKEIQRNIERRRDIAEVFIHAALPLASRTKHKRFISKDDNEYCNYSFALVLETGLKDVAAYAKKKEIEITPAFGNTIAGAAVCEGCPAANSLVLRTILFPIYPRLRSVEVERISRLIMTLP